MDVYYDAQSNGTTVCTAMPYYGQCPKSQHGIHKPEIRHYISFGLRSSYVWVERRSVGFGAPENTFITVGMSKMPCSIPKLLPFPVYGFCRILDSIFDFWHWSYSGCVERTSTRLPKYRYSRWNFANILFLMEGLLLFPVLGAILDSRMLVHVNTSAYHA